MIAPGEMAQPGEGQREAALLYASPYVRKVMAVAIETGQRKSWS